MNAGLHSSTWDVYEGNKDIQKLVCFLLYILEVIKCYLEGFGFIASQKSWVTVIVIFAAVLRTLYLVCLVVDYISHTFYSLLPRTEATGIRQKEMSYFCLWFVFKPSTHEGFCSVSCTKHMVLDFSTHEGASTSLLNLPLGLSPKSLTNLRSWSITRGENLLACSKFTQEIVDAHEGSLLHERVPGAWRGRRKTCVCRALWMCKLWDWQTLFNWISSYSRMLDKDIHPHTRTTVRTRYHIVVVLEAPLHQW